MRIILIALAILGTTLTEFDKIVQSLQPVRKKQLWGGLN